MAHGLSTSIWAPPSLPRPVPLRHHFHRFEQSCHRLRWKFIDLERAYARALDPSASGFTPADAERNFKVDFYEFYAWIEQAVVFLLGVFGVRVRHGKGGRHTYHHDVLKVLDDERSPLYGCLGRGDVNQALWKAKELRNRWKDAAEGRETPALKMYDLGWIVRQILGGLDEAYVVASRSVHGDADGVGGMVLDEREDDDDGWDWMVESMDWETC